MNSEGEVRILVIAPDMALNNIRDLLAAASGNHVDVLSGMVTSREVLKQISDGGFDIIHFATHGNRSALQMSNGLLSDDLLRQALSGASSVELVVLNSCESVATAAQLYRAGVPKVIGWRDQVDDRFATLWAQTFYGALSVNGGDVWASFGAANDTLTARYPEAETPILLNGRLMLLEAEIDRLREELHRVGVVRIPLWLVAGQMALVVALLIALIGRGG